MTSLCWKSPSALNTIRLHITIIWFRNTFINLANRTTFNTGVATLKKVILNQKLYNVYMFKYNFYFYHDMQVDSFDEVIRGESN